MALDVFPGRRTVWRGSPSPVRPRRPGFVWRPPRLVEGGLGRWRRRLALDEPVVGSFTGASSLAVEAARVLAEAAAAAGTEGVSSQSLNRIRVPETTMGGAASSGAPTAWMGSSGSPARVLPGLLPKDRSPAWLVRLKAGSPRQDGLFILPGQFIVRDLQDRFLADRPCAEGAVVRSSSGSSGASASGGVVVLF